MAVEITTMKRVYLRQELEYLRKSAHHTIWAPAPVQPAGATTQALVSLTFYNGIAENVPTLTYDLFRDLGYVTTEAPTAWWQERRG